MFKHKWKVHGYDIIFCDLMRVNGGGGYSTCMMSLHEDVMCIMSSITCS